jgi:hypothetical protein
MSEFEKLLDAFVSDVASGHEGRVQRNMTLFELCRSDAELLDEIQTSATRETAKLVGRRIDRLSGKVRAGALLMLMTAFLNDVLVMTAAVGHATTPNPNRPDCSCENCQLARAASVVLAQPMQEVPND